MWDIVRGSLIGSGLGLVLAFFLLLGYWVLPKPAPRDDEHKYD